jgi:hypothetical protein
MPLLADHILRVLLELTVPKILTLKARCQEYGCQSRGMKEGALRVL